MGPLDTFCLAWRIGGMVTQAVEAHRKRWQWKSKAAAMGQLNRAATALAMEGAPLDDTRRKALALEVAAIAVRLMEGDA